MLPEIRLDNFSGPLDLLLHLIKREEMDIRQIRIGEITEQYLAIIDQMKLLDLDVAGEYLLMAAQLIHIKSRLLLPVSDEIQDEEGEDPRAELVRRLLEYQRYKEAGHSFELRPQLERDVFLPRPVAETALPEEGSQGLDIEISVFQLAKAFYQLMQSARTEVFHEVVRETLSVAEVIARISGLLVERSRIPFRDFFRGTADQLEIVVTFLALLELVKMQLIKVEQVALYSDIWLARAVPVEQLQQVRTVDETLDYV